MGKIGSYTYPKLESIIKNLIKNQGTGGVDLPSTPQKIGPGEQGTVPPNSNLNLEINCDDRLVATGNEILTIDGLQNDQGFNIFIPEDASVDGRHGTHTITFVSSLSTPSAGTIHVKSSGTNSVNQANLVNAINGTADSSNISYPSSGGLGSSGVKGVTASASGDLYVSLTSVVDSSAANNISLTNNSGNIYRTAITMSGGQGLEFFAIEGTLIIDDGALASVIPCDFDIASIVAGNAITVTDTQGTDGASGEVTVNVDINKLSSGTVADGDLVAVYDINGDGTTDGDLRKVTALSIAQLATGGGGGGSPQGSDTQIQYNNDGSFGGIAKFIWNDTNLVIGDTSTNTALFFREDDTASTNREPRIYSDGTQNLTIKTADSKGELAILFGECNFGTTEVDINDGTMDSVVIGEDEAAAGTFTVVVAETRANPDAAGGADLGSSTKEWGDIYIYKDKYIRLGDATSQDLDDVPAIIGYDDANTDRLLLSSSAGTIVSGSLYMRDNVVLELDHRPATSNNSSNPNTNTNCPGGGSTCIAYINFGNPEGESGYGIRWYDGVMQVRDIDRAWSSVGIQGSNVQAVDSSGDAINPDEDGFNAETDGLTSNVVIVGSSTTKIKKPTTTITTNAQPLSIDSDSGLFVGAGSDLKITLSSDDAIFYNQTEGKDIIFQVYEDTANQANQEVLRIDGGDGMVGVRTSSPEVALDVHMVGSADPNKLSTNKGGGEVVYFGTEDGTDTLAQGRLMYLNTSGVWKYADASSVSSGADSLLAIALGSAVTDGLLIRGFYRGTTYTPDVSIGKALYVGETAGYLVTTRPSTSGAYVRIVGYFLAGGTGSPASAEVFYFNPDGTWVEIN